MAGGFGQNMATLGMHMRTKAQQTSGPRRSRVQRTFAARWRWLLATAPGLLCLAPEARGQYALQVAQSNADYGRSLNQPAALGHYNIKTGPMAWNFGAALSLGYNSNPALTSRNSGGDSGGSFYVTPSVTAAMLWPMTELNSITFGVTAGYQEYFSNSAQSGFYINPNSQFQLAYNVFLGESIRITFYDRFSVSQYSYMDPSVTGYGADNRSANNDVGTVANWRIEKGNVSLGFDHNNLWQLNDTGNFDSTNPQQILGGVGDMTSEVINGQFGYTVTPTLTLGPQVGLNWMSYERAALGNAFQWNVGAFGTWQATPHVKLNGSLGYTVYTQDSSHSVVNALVNNQGNENSPVYFNLGWSHELSSLLTYTVTGSHTLTTGQYAGPSNQYTAGMGLAWNLIRNVGTSMNFSWNRGENLFALTTQPYNYYVAGLNLSRQFSQHISASLIYNITWRDSDQLLGSYTVNNIGLTGTYSF
jgi:hypothetical protein